MATLTKEYDKSLYENHSIVNPNLNEFDKIFDDYTTSHNRKLNIYFINCEFNFVFDNNFKLHIEVGYCHSKDDITKLKSYLLCWTENYKLQGYSFCKINEVIIKTISDKCNIAYKHHIDQPCKRSKED